MKRKNLSISIVSVMVAIFVLTSLLFGGVRGAEAKKIKIGFILKSMQEERYQKDKAIFTEKAES